METITLSEFRDRFGKSTERRKELCSRFEEWLGIAIGSSVLLRVWVYGSFVSTKPYPNDVDLFVLVSADHDVEEQPAAIRPYFRHEILRSAWDLDVFLMPLGRSDAYVDDVLQTLSRGRLGQGVMLEVMI